MNLDLPKHLLHRSVGGGKKRVHVNKSDDQNKHIQSRIVSMSTSLNSVCLGKIEKEVQLAVYHEEKSGYKHVSPSAEVRQK